VHRNQSRGLGKVRIHDLRHSAEPPAIALGAHPKAIQVRMGHNSIEITMNRCGHLFDATDEAIADGLDAAFRGPVKPEPPAGLVVPLSVTS
jgi:integrase